MLHLFIYYGLFTASSFYALAHGGAPERLVAIVMIVGIAITPVLLNPVATRFYGVETRVFVLDVAILIAFTGIALSANRFWPMGIVVFHGMSVLGHLLKLADPRLIRTAYLVMLAFWLYPQLLLLVLGTWRHRVRLKATGVDPSWRTSSHR
ncbi:hypothetical protein GCM10009087_43900 [Sphingomonas oligophenolica]|uniref:Uncharacterized protein n=1 Tax=Sphingomonas oligophenolica TaxID=301154 RepID=A0ABU9XZU1_9SPHN